jgi:hypothetical protein
MKGRIPFMARAADPGCPRRARHRRDADMGSPTEAPIERLRACHILAEWVAASAGRKHAANDELDKAQSGSPQGGLEPKA